MQLLLFLAATVKYIFFVFARLVLSFCITLFYQYFNLYECGKIHLSKLLINVISLLWRLEYFVYLK